MDVDQARAFAAIAGSRTPEEKKAFSAQLLADHDAIVRYDFLKANLESTPKDDRKVIYAKLLAETAKYPATSHHDDPLFGKPLLALRAKMGLFRGLKWDRYGKIRVSNDVRHDSIRNLQAKLDEFLGPNADPNADYGPKVATIRQSIAEHQAVIDGRVKPAGSIWDFILSDAPTASKISPAPEV